MKNYYEILEVNEHASQEVIEKAYKVLAKKYHPDLYSEEERLHAEQKLRDINEAYKVLSDDFLKSQYDIELQRVRNEEFLNLQNKIKENKEYTEETKKTTQKPILNWKWNNKNQNNNEQIRKNNVGSMGGIIDIIREILKVKPDKIKPHKMTKTDFTALILTIVIIIILGVILWFIPFTNGWMRQLIFENPLFSWIWN